MSKSVVALEITEEHVRAVEVRPGRTPLILAAGSVPLPPDSARDSEILDSDAVAIAVRQLWSHAGIKSRSVILALGSRRILVRDYTTQAMTADMMRQALPYQVQDLLPVPIDQAVLDFYPASEVGDQVSGLLVAAVAEQVESLISTLAKAKIEVDVVDLLPFGLARISRSLLVPGETAAMIHITDHTTYVVVMLDGIPRFVRIIPVDLPTTTVRARRAAEMQGSLVAQDEFEELLAPAGVGAPLRSRASMRVGGSVTTAPDPNVADLVHQVRNTIRFANERPGAAPVTSVYLSGAGSAIPDVAAAIGQVLGTRVEYVNINMITTSKITLEGEFALDLVGTLGVVYGGTF